LEGTSPTAERRWKALNPWIVATGKLILGSLDNFCPVFLLLESDELQFESKWRATEKILGPHIEFHGLPTDEAFKTWLPSD